MYAEIAVELQVLRFDFASSFEQTVDGACAEEVIDVHAVQRELVVKEVVIGIADESVHAVFGVVVKSVEDVRGGDGFVVGCVFLYVKRRFEHYADHCVEKELRELWDLTAEGHGDLIAHEEVVEEGN